MTECNKILSTKSVYSVYINSIFLLLSFAITPSRSHPVVGRRCHRRIHSHPFILAHSVAIYTLSAFITSTAFTLVVYFPAFFFIMAVTVVVVDVGTALLVC